MHPAKLLLVSVPQQEFLIDHSSDVGQHVRPDHSRASPKLNLRTRIVHAFEVSESCARKLRYRKPSLFNAFEIFDHTEIQVMPTKRGGFDRSMQHHLRTKLWKYLNVRPLNCHERLCAYCKEHLRRVAHFVLFDHASRFEINLPRWLNEQLKLFGRRSTSRIVGISPSGLAAPNAGNVVGRSSHHRHDGNDAPANAGAAPWQEG